MSSKKRNIYIFLGKVILITLLIVFCIRTFFAELYMVSSKQMEATLVEGDKILIDKTAYGVRLPITPLSIPFTFDKIGGSKSYSTLVELPVKRLFERKVECNDIVLFNNPLDSLKPLDKRELVLSRCVAQPGDTICMKNGTLYINENIYIHSSDVIDRYSFNISDKKTLEEIMENLEITPFEFKQYADSGVICLSKLEAFLLNESMPDTIPLTQITDSTLNYSLIIPYKGQKLKLNVENLKIYKQIILSENKYKAHVSSDGKLYIDSREQIEYTFRDDYYWMLSDNRLGSLDSRSLGFIPFKNVIGKACFICYNTNDKRRNFTSID